MCWDSLINPKCVKKSVHLQRGASWTIHGVYSLIPRVLWGRWVSCQGQLEFSYEMLWHSDRCVRKPCWAEHQRVNFQPCATHQAVQKRQDAGQWCWNPCGCTMHCASPLAGVSQCCFIADGHAKQKQLCGVNPKAWCFSCDPWYPPSSTNTLRTSSFPLVSSLLHSHSSLHQFSLLCFPDDFRSL